MTECIKIKTDNILLEIRLLIKQNKCKSIKNEATTVTRIYLNLIKMEHINGLTLVKPKL